MEQDLLLRRLIELLELTSYDEQQFPFKTILQIISDLANITAFEYSIISIERVCHIIASNLTQNTDIDKNAFFGDEFVAMIRKIISHFVERDISLRVGLLLESIFNSLSRENCNVLVDDALVQFVVKFMKLNITVASDNIAQKKYWVIAMRISVVCPIWIPELIKHVDIQQLKQMIWTNKNDQETMFIIHDWIYHISAQPCGIEFILKDPRYFMRILCELVKNTTHPIFFQTAVMALENILRLENPAVQEFARSELSG
jgi:hypothetical protein